MMWAFFSVCVLCASGLMAFGMFLKSRPDAAKLKDLDQQIHALRTKTALR